MDLPSGARLKSTSTVLTIAAEIVRTVEVDFNLAPLGKSIDVPPEGRGQASFVEQWGMQQMRNRADFLAHFANQVFAVGEHGGGLSEEVDVGSHSRQVH